MLEARLNFFAIKDNEIVPIASSDVNMEFSVTGIKTYADMKDGHMPEWSQCPNGLSDEYYQWSWYLNSAVCQWDVDGDEENGVVKWFIGTSETHENNYKYKAFLATRQDVDQYNKTGVPKEMRGAWNQQLTLNFQGEEYYTNFILGYFGESEWQIFENLGEDEAKDIFEDAVLEELGVADEIVKTISAFDDASEVNDTWKGINNRSWYIHVYSNIAEVRKMLWLNNDEKRPTIITPLIKKSDDSISTDYYVLFRSSEGDAFDVIITKLNF